MSMCWNLCLLSLHIFASLRAGRQNLKGIVEGDLDGRPHVILPIQSMISIDFCLVLRFGLWFSESRSWRESDKSRSSSGFRWFFTWQRSKFLRAAVSKAYIIGASRTSICYNSVVGRSDLLDACTQETCWQLQQNFGPVAWKVNHFLLDCSLTGM